MSHLDHLKELTYIVNKNKIKRIDLLSLHKDATTKINQFYQLLSSNQVSTDDEAYEQLFEGKSSKAVYRSLKVALRRKLMNTIFFIDTYHNNYSDRQIAFYEIQKEYAAIQILLAKNARKSSVDMLVKLLKKAVSYEFTDIVKASARILCLHYGTREGVEKKYRHYQEIWEQYDLYERLECKAERYYTELVLFHNNNKAAKLELQQKAIAYFKELQKDRINCSSYKFYFFSVLVELIQYSCVNDYYTTIPICDEIIAFFEAKPYTANTPIQICLHHQLVAYMQAKDYENGEQIALKSRALIEPGSFNWFKNLEYIFLLAMHTANYQSAYHTFSAAVKHKRFKFLPQAISEMWTLYQAYLHLLIDQEKIELDENDKTFSTNFRLNRFLNNMPTYSKDKQGVNIAVLIVQILFYIQKRKYATAIDRIEAIEKYCSRYLFKEDTIRSYYFIKLLLTIPKSSFHKTAVIRHAKGNLKKMNDIGTEPSLQYHKIEILPYEVLWEIALSMLDAKTIKLNRSRQKKMTT